MLDACSRLLDLLDSPQDIPFLGGLIQREIIYRLLRGPQGNHLRAIATLGEQSQRTAKAVAWLRTNYAKPLRVEELAAMARMGVSTLASSFPLAHSHEPAAISKAAPPSRRARTHAATKGSTPPAPPSKWATKARASSIASTAAFSGSRRCATSKPAALPGLLPPTTDLCTNDSPTFHASASGSLESDGGSGTTLSLK